MSNLLKSLKAKVKVNKYSLTPYPRSMWIVRCDNKDFEEVRSKFTPVNGTQWGELRDFSDTEAVVFQVYETESRELGYLIWLRSADCSEATMVHEAGHVVLHLFQDIDEVGIYDAQEPFCYMLEWVYCRIKDCWYGR